jgi:sortase A
MRPVVPRKALQWILRSTQCAFLVVAAGTLAYCAYVLMDGWMFQNREHHRLDYLSDDRQAKPGVGITTPAAGLVGRIEIPRLGVSVMVFEGVEAATLRRAAGHIPGTALPGHGGNVGIAGHRDTLFRPLRNIRRNDLITLTTPRGEYRYRVLSTKIVNPGDVAVLNPDGNEILTLVTCYPFYFVGSAPDRFIVRAERVLDTT